MALGRTIRGGDVTWRVDDSQWIAGCARLPRVLGNAAADRLEEVVNHGFERTQEIVHVRTGALKASGRVERREEGHTVTFEAVYGGGDVDYAGYEELLHPYLEPSMVEAMAEFEQTTNVLDDSPVGGLL